LCAAQLTLVGDAFVRLVWAFDAIFEIAIL
jgi:hypothetical protein